MKNRQLKPGIIGKDGRTSAIERCLRESVRVLGEPIRLSDWKNESVDKAKANVLRRARQEHPDFVIVGPEEPLAEGIVDDLQTQLGIPCIGPTQGLARLESSKAFTRDLLTKHGIPGNPEYKVFRNTRGIERYLKKLGDYVVKPDGLTGGKGVKISDAHLYSVEQAVEYCEDIFKRKHEAVVIEEKLDGEEFSLQSFCDGTHVVHMIPVQDHKRLQDGDRGPNTGGMGSYSCEDHRLPFLTAEHLDQSKAINESVALALFKETGQKYKGILYGGFMVTRGGIRLLEYNARFGDPETLNVLSVLETDLVDICEAIVEERLNELDVKFRNSATVCKYIVPEGYPDNPVKERRIDLTKVPSESDRLRVYKAAVEERNGQVYLTGSRAIAFVGIGKDLSEAEATAEEAASSVSGPVFHRRDIGTRDLVQHRIDHVNSFARPTPAENCSFS